MLVKPNRITCSVCNCECLLNKMKDVQFHKFKYKKKDIRDTFYAQVSTA